MTMTNLNDDMLDDVFAQARSTQPVPDDGLMARVLADAGQVQAGFTPTETASQPAGLWARILDTLGGWPAVGSLATATVAGVWIGVAPPQSVSDATAAILGDEVSVSIAPFDSTFEFGAIADG